MHQHDINNIKYIKSANPQSIEPYQKACSASLSYYMQMPFVTALHATVIMLDIP